MSYTEDYMYLNTLPYGTSNLPERIVCAATDYDKVLLVGVRHGSADMFNVWDYVETHNPQFFDDLDQKAQGFITNKGRFVDRKEAWKIALEQRQIVRLVGSQSVDNSFEDTELFSENLY